MKVVCFDLGGVLVRITMSVAEAGRRAGIPNLPELAFADVPCFQDYQAGRLSCKEYVRLLGEVIGTSEADALATHNHILIEPYSGTLELVQELGESRQTACLSNTNELHWREMLGSERFPNVRALHLPVASHVVGLEKPYPAMYAEFERLAGAHGPEIAFFDDSRANVEAAQSRGWNAHWIDPSGDTAAQMRERLGL